MGLKLNIFQKPFLRHAIFWVVIALYEIVNEGWKAREVLTLMPQAELFSIIPIAMLLSYFNLYVLMPRYYFSKKHLSYVALLILLLVIGGALQRYFSYVLWIPIGKIYDPSSYRADISNYWNFVRILRNSFLFFPIIIVHMLLKIMQVDREREIKLGPWKEKRKLLK